MKAILYVWNSPELRDLVIWQVNVDSNALIVPQDGVVDERILCHGKLRDQIVWKIKRNLWYGVFLTRKLLISCGVWPISKITSKHKYVYIVQSNTTI